jgi:outer membrane protein assembly factor BamB
VRTVPRVIDLGEFAYGHDPERERQPRPSRSPRVRRWLPAALVAAFIAPLAGAAAPPGAPPLTPLWTVVGSAQRTIALSEQTLYAITSTDRGAMLTRYELADGAVRWATPLDGRGEWSAIELAVDVPVVVTAEQGGVGRVTGYDPDTGLPRWRHEGWPSTTVAGGRLVLDRWQPGPLADDGLPPSDLVAVDVHTGEIVWTIQTEGDERELYGWASQPDPGSAPTELVTLGRSDGRLIHYDLATGSVIAATDLPTGQPYYAGVGGSVPSALFAQLQTWVFASELAHPAVADGLVMLSEPGSAVTAYDLATLAPRWRLLGHSWAAPCGPVVCAVDGDLSELVGVDPLTGSVRWSWSCRGHGPAGESCYVLPTAQGPGDPMLVQQWQLGRGGVDTAWLVEPTTGVPVAELGQWRSLGQLDGESWLLRWVDKDEPVFGRGVPPERTWLARLHVDPVELEVLGSIEAPTCQPHRTYLVCWPGERADAVVWRVS